MKIYTKKGDDGTTGLLYGGRVGKDDLRTHAYGTVDEAVSALGLARSFGPSATVSDILLRVQRELFAAGAELATREEQRAKLVPGVSRITQEMTLRLEEEIDRLTQEHPLPEEFVLPGELSVSAALDLARTVVRRAERQAVAMAHRGMLEGSDVLPYLNRLSDLLFVLARYEEAERGVRAKPSRST